MKEYSKSFSCPLPQVDIDTITIGHGSGGQLTSNLLEKTIFPLFSNNYIDQQHDGAVFPFNGQLAISTDSFVVSPIFFPGGNIGDLAINGTMNDLAMCGAVPKYLSLALIIEEGLRFEELWAILVSISDIAKAQGVKIVTGDTKVVERGKGDKIFINTTGIGMKLPGASIGMDNIKVGDHVLVSGDIGTHGMAIMSVREGLEFGTNLLSDTCYVGHVSGKLIENFGKKIHFLRDPTRGGLATTLNEIASSTGRSIQINESLIPMHEQARSACEMLGLDPVYVANEGVFVAVVSPDISSQVLEMLHESTISESAAFIGEVHADFPKKVIMNSEIGGRRIVPMLQGEQFPRIC